LGTTAANAAHEQERTRERRRGERRERDEGRERDDHHGDHRELRDDEQQEHGPEDADGPDPFESVAHAFEPATPPAAGASTTIEVVR
jgi:hypothetical protein